MEPTVLTEPPTRPRPRWRMIALLVVVIGGGGALAYRLATNGAAGPDAVEIYREIHVIESRTSELDAEMTAFSEQVRRGLFTRFVRSFADEMTGTTPFPSAPTSVVPARDGIRAGRWTLAAPTSLSGLEMAESLERFAGRLVVLDDVRFDVTRSRIRSDGATLDGTTTLELTGRTRDGRLEWIRGRASIVAHRTGAAEAAPYWRIDEFRFTHLESLTSEREAFTEVTAAAGLDARPSTVRGGRAVDGAGGGAATADVDLDGHLDLVIASAGTNGRLALWRGRGDGTFEAAGDAIVGAKVGDHAAPVFLDFDDDGDPDLFVVRDGRPTLFRNDLRPGGDLQLTPVPGAFAGGAGWSARSAAVGDVDGNGFADVYVACSADPADPDPVDWTRRTGGSPNRLLLNRGDGTFDEAAEAWGAAEATARSFAAVLYDRDDDGDLDLHVANAFGAEDAVLRNDGARFADARDASGIRIEGGRGVAVGDVDADGRLDLYVARTTSLLADRMLARFAPGDFPPKDRLAGLLDGNALFRAGVDSGRFPVERGGAVRLVDLDLDGCDDLLAVGDAESGAEADAYWVAAVVSAVDPTTLDGNRSFHVATRPRRNDRVDLSRGDGTFFEVSGVTGLGGPAGGRSVVTADFDDDGDSDVLVAAPDGTVRLHRNDLGGDRWIRVSLVDETGGARDAFGATVRVKTSFGVIAKTKDGGSGFASQSDPRLLFGLGDDRVATWVEVAWPGGEKQRVEDVPAGVSILVRRGVAAPVTVDEAPASLGAGRRFDFDAERSRRAAPFRVTIGEPLPVVDLAGLDGVHRLLPDVAEPNRFMLVSLFRTGDARSVEELPELQRLHAEGTRSVRVVLLGDEPEDVIARFVSDRRLAIPVYRLDDAARKALVRDPDAFPVPTTFVLDRQGRLVDVRDGWSYDLRAKYLR